MMRTYKEAFSLKKELVLIPGYILLFIWCIFTFVMIGWIFAASFSTTRDIFSGTLFKSGIHFDNYVKAFTANRVGTYFLNSMIYTFTSCFAIICIAAPCSYVLARYVFRGNKFIQNLFISALGIPQVMILLPLFSVVSQLNINNNRIVLIVLYTCINIPFTVFFLMSFFSTLSFSFEEAASIDGCGPIMTFWKIMFPLAQPGIITVTIFNFIVIWNEFIMSMIFAAKTEIRPLSYGLFAMVQSMRYTGDWAGMFAAVIIVFVPTLFLYLFLSEKIIAGVTGGAIKG